MAPKKRPDQQQDSQATAADLEIEAVADQAQAQGEQGEAAAPRPPQGIVPRLFNTGTPAIDFHRMHQPRGTIPGVRRIDPASLRSPEGADPWLRYPNGAVAQIRADHAAEMLEVGPLGSESPYRLATDEEIEKAKAQMQANLRR